MIRKANAEPIYLLMAVFYGVVGKITFAMSTIYRVNMVGLDVLQLLLLGTVLEASVFLFEVPTGVIADVYSRRLSVIIGTVLMGLGFILEGLFPVFVSVLLAQIIWGIGWTFISGARPAWLTDEVGVERAGKLFLIVQQIVQVGSLLGILLAVPLARFSLQFPYFVGGSLFLFQAVILALFMPEENFHALPKEERQGWKDLFGTMREGFRLMRRRSALMWYALIALFVGLYSEGWDRLKEPHLLANHTFPDPLHLNWGAIEWFAAISIASSLLIILSNQIAIRYMDTGSTTSLARGLQAIYAVMVLSMVGFALAGNFWTAISFMLLFDMLRGVTFPLSTAFVNHFLDSRVRATVLSMTGQIDAFGQMAGGPVIGGIGQVASIPVAIISSAAILFPAVPLFSLVLRGISSKEVDHVQAA